MVERLAPLLRGLDEDLELGGYLPLVNEVGKPLRAKRGIQLVLAAGQLRVGQALGCVEALGLPRGRRFGDPRIASHAHVRAPVPSAALRSAALMSSSAL